MVSKKVNFLAIVYIYSSINQFKNEYVIKMVETVVGLNYPTEEMQLEYLN